MRHKFCLLAIIIAILPSCGGSMMRKEGQPINVPWASGPQVYHGDIQRKYTTVKVLNLRLRQISGPNYYDDIATVPMISREAAAVGADAVIKYRSKRIEGQNILDPGFFEASGVAIKFAK